MPAITIPQSIIQEAEYILQPPTPPLSPIKAVRGANLKTLMSVSGTISEEKTTKTLFIERQETKFKSITLNDTTDSVKITLWREATDFPIQIGNYVKITHLTLHEFNGEKILNTTQHTQLQVIEPPQEKITITIYGLEKTKQELSTITAQVQNTEHFQSMDVNNTVLMDFLKISIDVDDFGDALMPHLPITLNVLFSNGCITEIVEQL
ncbi:uncharacterized protein LOC144821904 [Lissotriton helveticus]